MSYRQILRILGVLMLMYSFTLLPPFLLSLYFADGTTPAFSAGFTLISLTGLAAWWPHRRHRDELTPRDGFLVVFMFWMVFGIVGALPFLLAPHHDLRLVDALFESFSGLTGTGTSVIPDLDNMPPTLNYYRHQLCWLGGMGIVVLAVAVMPMLGIGGMQLYRAEAPGVVKDKLTPRITETAKSLWLIYLGLTLICVLAFYLAGMSWFDAVCHAFSTIATAGFSTHSESVAYFQQPLIEYLTVLFMILGSVNFALHFAALGRGRFQAYWRDPELRFFLFLLLMLVAITTVALSWNGIYENGSDNFRHALFQATSMITTTGLVSADFSNWPGMLPILLVSACIIGGCAGSTSSGIKPLRLLMVMRHSLREISRLIHPSGVFAIRVGRKPVSPRVVDSVWSFLTLYGLTFFVLMGMVMATGLDFESAYGAVACSLNNAGAGLGSVANGYAGVPDVTKFILMLAMVLGRLEIFTVLVLLTPAFWRR